MRIAVLGSGSAATTLPEHFRELANDTVTPELVDPRLSVFALTPYERLVVDVGYVDAGQQAERLGCDAVMINSFADYGLDALRSVLTIPVFGAGESTMLAAAKGGRRFSIVTIWPRSLAHLYDERLRALALGEQCVSVRYVLPEVELTRLTDDDGAMARMHRGDRTIVDRLVAECERAVREDGAECIALGCTCMAPIGPAVEAACSVPVLESARVGFRAAATALRSAPRPVRREPLVAPERRDLVPRLVDAWVGVGAPPLDTHGGDCPVCIASPPSSVN